MSLLTDHATYQLTNSCVKLNQANHVDRHFHRAAMVVKHLCSDTNGQRRVSGCGREQKSKNNDRHKAWRYRETIVCRELNVLRPIDRIFCIRYLAFRKTPMRSSTSCTLMVTVRCVSGNPKINAVQYYYRGPNNLGKKASKKADENARPVPC